MQAIVNDAERAGYPNVFALIDRDFRPTNRTSWMNPQKTFRTFVLPVHEIENYLLDAAALAPIRLNNLGKTEAEIDDMMALAAGRLCWWMACRNVIAVLRQRLREEFLSDPPRNLSTEGQAREHICNSAWFRKLPQEVGQTTEAHVHQLLTEAHRAADQSLVAGRWKTEFAGKEILRDVGSRICNQKQIRGYRPTQAQFDEDLAKEVGAWQRQNNTVPTDLTDLLGALQQRIAPPHAGP